MSVRDAHHLIVLFFSLTRLVNGSFFDSDCLGHDVRELCCLLRATVDFLGVRKVYQPMSFIRGFSLAFLCRIFFQDADL